MFDSGLIHTDHNQQTSLLIADSSRQVNPVRIQINDLRIAQTALAPGFVLLFELLIQTGHRRRRQRRFRAQQSPQGRLEIPRRQTLDEQPGKQFLDRLRTLLIGLDQL